MIDVTAGGRLLGRARVGGVRVEHGLRSSALYFGIATFALGVLASLGIGTEWVVNLDRAQTVDSAMAANAALARLLEEHSRRTFTYAEQIALQAGNEYRRLGRKFDLVRFVRNSQIDRELIVNIVVGNERGWTALGSAQGFVPIGFADREYAQVLAAPDTGQAFISRPVKAGIAGRDAIVLTRRISRSDGSFAGVIGVAIDPHYFANFYRRIDIGAKSAIYLAGLDGVSRVRVSGAATSIGQDVRGTELYRRLQDSPHASYIESNRVDGVSRILSYETVHGYPLVVVASTSEEEILANHAKRKVFYYSSATAVGLTVFLATFWLLTLARRQSRASAQLDNARRRLQTQIERMPLAHIVWDKEFRVSGWNPAAEKLFGWTVGEAMGRHAYKLIVPTDAREHVEAVWREIVRDGKMDSHSINANLTKDGGRIDCEWFNAPLRDEEGKIAGCLSMVSDITERKSAEQDRVRLAAMVESSEDAIFGRALEGIITTWNPAAERLFGYAAAEIVGKQASILVPPELEHEYVSNTQVIERGGSVPPYETVRVAKNGRRIDVSLSVSPVRDAEGRLNGVSLIARDISVRKRAERLLRLEHAVTRILAEADETHEALQAAIRAVCESENWDCGRYFDADSGAGVLRFEAAWGVPTEAIQEFLSCSRELSFPAGAGLVGWVWQSGQPLWIPDVTQDVRTRQQSLAHKFGVHSALISPVQSEGKYVGVLAFSSREVRKPSEDMLQTMATIGNHIGQFWQRRMAQERERERALQQRLIAEFGQEALANSDIGRVLDRVVKLLAATLKVERCNVLEVESHKRWVNYKAAVGWPKEWIETRHSLAEPGSLVHYILSRNEPLIVEDYGAETRFAPPPLLQSSARSGVHVPIVGSRGPIGIVGVDTQRPRRFTEDDVNFVQSVANILASAIERKNAEERLAQLAQFDHLTGLPNRHLFLDRLAQTLAHAKRSGDRVAVLFIDLDRFKLVNDTLGHAAGDKLLAEIAERIKRCVRSGDTVGRFAGDEFGAILPDLARLEDAGLVAQKILDALARPIDLDGHEIFTTASVGISIDPVNDTGPEALIVNADIAMYRAKERGRNNFQYFTPEMNERAVHRVRLEALLRRALDRKEFRLLYQPKVDLRTGKVSGFEALLRWQHPQRGLVGPDEFIPLIEDMGLIVPVGQWVLREACTQIRAWQHAASITLPVAINLSARQFQQADLEIIVGRTLRETGVDPSLVHFEITESLLMQDPESTARSLHRLKHLGVSLSVDDFGTGYSSLAYLKRFPLDTLKIDRAFIRDIPGDPDDSMIAQAIISLAHNLRLRVVAEGVETEAQLNFLRSRHCDEMQGFYFAQPLAAHDCIQALIEDWRLHGTDARTSRRAIVPLSRIPERAK
jgi:diguanylate cyclase (GGDEF)-like protein/PAS domain S-box-containing protein